MLWLNFRQKKSIQNSFHVVPPSFKKDISLKDHQKAGLYSLDKLKVDNFEILFSSLLLALWTIGGGIDLIIISGLLIHMKAYQVAFSLFCPS